ncbi:MAG: hypothetical protein U1B83_02640, partial [Candidatus Cloacimonadaceae bacterium]|nr:hypothetical protein [Candidatus Cloacimonadaceae bacterium]
LSATDSNIYAQKVWGGAGGTSGTLQWLATGVPVSTTHDSLQRHPQAVSDGAGGVIVVYDSGENIPLGNGYDIYANHIDSAGNPSVVGGYVVCTWETDQTMPMIAYSDAATNNAIYAWLDKRNEPAPGIHDIYTLGVLETYTYTVASHDITGLVAGDLGAEIWFNGSPFATPIYTGYVFGAPGNEPMLAGTYTVHHPTFGSWTPASYTITDIGMNHSTDFLGIRYILNVTSAPTGQDIFLDATDLGQQTNNTFLNNDLSAIVGNYTLQDAPAGFHWVPVNNSVIGSDFTIGNDYTHSIHFALEADAPVYTYTVASHDVTGIVVGDLGAEILFNGAPFTT